MFNNINITPKSGTAKPLTHPDWLSILIMEIHITIPNWLAYTFVYSTYAITILLMWWASIKLVATLCAKRFGKWVFKSAIGLVNPIGNSYDGHVQCILDDIEEKTGVRYVKQDNDQDQAPR
jgi:hypothetical protein